MLAAAHLHEVRGVGENEPVIVCPADSYADETYFQTLKKLADRVLESPDSLVLMGIEPTGPSEKYGYIIPESTEDICPVKSFKEKPDRAKAEQYISEGGLWNAGVFAFSLGYLLDAAEKILGTSSHGELLEGYENLEKISFDYALVEKAKKVEVVRFGGEWKDVGTWSSLSEIMEKEVTRSAVGVNTRSWNQKNFRKEQYP